MSHRVERIGDCELHLADCRDVLRGLRVDLIVTSPPYNKGKQSGAYANMRDAYASYEDDKPEAEYIKWQQEVLSMCWQAVSPEGAIFYNHKPQLARGEIVLPIRLAPEDARLRQIIIWDRKGGMNWGDGHFCPTHEWILLFAHERFRLKSRAASALGDVWTLQIERDRYGHPCPYPVSLPYTAISATTAETVFDPFMGSGTTGVAAARLGRKFVGSEIDPKYFEIACERISAAYKQPDLFVSSPEPKAEQMDLLSM